MTSAAVRYRDTYLTVGNIRSAEAWDAANDGLAVIEAEAVAAERARIKAEVQALFGQFHPMAAIEDEPTRHDVVSRKAVLAIVEQP